MILQQRSACQSMLTTTFGKRKGEQQNSTFLKMGTLSPKTKTPTTGYLEKDGKSPITADVPVKKE